MDFKEIQELVKLINKSNLTEFKMEDGDFKLSIRTKKYGKQRSAPPQQQIVSVPTSPITPVQQPYVSPAPPASPPSTPAATSDAAESDNKAQQEAAATDEGSGNYIEVKSPIVGTFYRSASPDKPPYVKVGDTINVGSVVCIVEAMKLFNEIESEVSGKVVKIMIDDASPVEYDQVLFLVDPAG